MHAAGNHRADENPQHAGQIAELRGQHRPDQRPGAGDGGKVMAKEHPFVGGIIVVAVVEQVGWCDVPVIQCQNFGCNKCRVETVGQNINADRGDQNPDRVDLFLYPNQPCRHGKGKSAHQRQNSPEYFFPDRHTFPIPFLYHMHNPDQPEPNVTISR